MCFPDCLCGIRIRCSCLYEVDYNVLGCLMLMVLFRLDWWVYMEYSISLSGSVLSQGTAIIARKGTCMQTDPDARHAASRE